MISDINWCSKKDIDLLLRYIILLIASDCFFSRGVKTMSLMDRIFDQGRKPFGIWGKIMGRLMNIAHVPFYRLLLEQVPIEKDHRILDIGCGGGKSLNLFAGKVPHGMVWGLDYSPEMVEMASKVNAGFINEGRVKVLQASVSQIPSGDNFFDLAVACETIHFWPDIQNDLREVFRVLKVGGHFVVVNKYAKDEREAASLEKYFSFHSPEYFRSALELAGFSVKKVKLMKDKGQIVLVALKE